MERVDLEARHGVLDGDPTAFLTAPPASLATTPLEREDQAP